MGQHDFQFDAVAYAKNALACHFRNRAAFHLRGDVFVYFEEGRPDVRVTPTVFVVCGSWRMPRSCYNAWETGIALQLGMEVHSHTTKANALEDKKEIYRWQGMYEF